MTINDITGWLRLPVPVLGSNWVAAIVAVLALALIVALMCWRPNKHPLSRNLTPAPHVDAQLHTSRSQVSHPRVPRDPTLSEMLGPHHIDNTMLGDARRSA